MSPETLPPAPAEAGAGRRNSHAVALANASLLGVGYLMLGRRRLAAATLAITLALAAILVFAARSFWFEAVVLLWWIAVSAHGLRLASRLPGPGDCANAAADAVLVLCVGETEFGSAVETCTYESDSDQRTVDVTFRKKALPVRVFEVRTARLVLDTRVEIGGASCPATMYAFGDPGPDHYVTTTASDVRAAFAPVIDP